MTTEELLDSLLVPRANGSEGFFQVASFIETRLREFAPQVELHTFTATPHGIQLLMAGAFVFMLGYAGAVALRRYRLALLLFATVAITMLAELEMMWSPVSGLIPLPENNIAGTFPSRIGAPTLIFSAHYDTATHFGDHVTWYRWGVVAAAAGLVAIALPLIGSWRRRRGLELPRSLTLPVAAFVLLPFAALAVCFSLGPAVRTPSPGALDNGGSLAVLLRLAERLAERPRDAPTTVKLVFLAAEEERTLGSWHYARTLDRESPVAVINLEIVGASEQLAYVSEEPFGIRSYRPSSALVSLVRESARELWGKPLPGRTLPGAMFTDGRSFLAHGIPTVTLMSATHGGPRHLHSFRDSRDRLFVPALDEVVTLLEAVVLSVDRKPSILAGAD